MAGTFNQNLRQIRKNKGVNQRIAAENLGVSQPLLSHYENGVREPGLAFVVRACDYFAVSADQLLGRTIDSAGDDHAKNMETLRQIHSDAGTLCGNISVLLANLDIKNQKEQS